MKQVYVVTRLEKGDEPIVTVFSNKEAAIKCLQYYILCDYKCCIDTCDIYEHFDLTPYESEA